ncbi:MAG: triose-phosphate isomerase [Xanthobacteraceae bacterium]|nr:triose-phosphate isomerase [Xanthobacteraceae bacterium]
MTRRPLVAGNWKMNGLRAGLAELEAICAGYSGALKAKADFLICPPSTLVAEAAAKTAGKGVMIGGQDCHAKASGAHTGDVSAEMLKDAGARFVIVGHSERRADHAETDAIVRAKADAAWRAGLTAIVCVGERKEQREGGKALAAVREQLAGSIPEGASPDRLVVAYEPVWAIGTGLTPTPGDVAEMHASIRAGLGKRFGAKGEEMRILYGGSVKPQNARDLIIQPDVDGALIGGASLKAKDFLGIAAAYT